jgi:starch phosphorylase
MNPDVTQRFTTVERTDGEIYGFKRHLLDHLKHTVGKNEVTTSDRDWYNATAFTVRDHLVDAWLESIRQTYDDDAKRVYYLSLEFLMGRSLINNLLNLQLYDTCKDTLESMGLDLETIADQETEAGLGNGGLGRLAACLIDSMATVGIPGYGYGIRYDYGMFHQRIANGEQMELPDNWLRYGNPWEFARPELTYPVKFFGSILEYRDDQGRLHEQWTNYEEVLAMGYDMPVPGYGARTVNHIRLWAAKSSRDFDLRRFNRGDYIAAIRDQAESESLSHVLYPDDTTSTGKALRLKQEYFFVSASLQDIMRRFFNTHEDLRKFPDKVAIQLNDTHPAIAIPELMRLLIDVHGLTWEEAWDITVRTFSYTNHTLLPEALETWPVELFEAMLPRHLKIMYEINHRFLQSVFHRFPGQLELMRRMSIFDDGAGRRVRMAHLAFVGSHRVNGVAAIHTELMKTGIFADFHRVFPDRIVNKTNGITPRRWLNQANRPLAALMSSNIGEDWISDLSQLRRIEPQADDPEYQAVFRSVKRMAKERLSAYTQERLGITLNVDSMFDVQVKRIHEYKRQLLNVLHVITRYNRIRANPGADILPRTVIFAGKAAPGYHVAKMIIRLINAVADVVNNDPVSKDRLTVLFLPNYNVSKAEIIIPAADLSEQISTAGTEASGTGNMKLALNGALTIGTRDGANIEIGQEVGEENIFFFGLNADEVAEMRDAGTYDPWYHYHNNGELRQVLDMLAGGYFSPDDPTRFMPIVDLLTRWGDFYMLLGDYQSYIDCQDRVDQMYRQSHDWTRRAILNVARIGKFSSDLTVLDYAKDIWKVDIDRLHLPQAERLPGRSKADVGPVPGPAVAPAELGAAD